MFSKGYVLTVSEFRGFVVDVLDDAGDYLKELGEFTIDDFEMYLRDSFESFLETEGMDMMVVLYGGTVGCSVLEDGIDFVREVARYYGIKFEELFEDIKKDIEL